MFAVTFTMLLTILGCFLCLPTISLLWDGFRNTATRYDWKNYLKAFGNQLYLPILGLKTVRDPENKKLLNEYLDLKVKKYIFKKQSFLQSGSFRQYVRTRQLSSFVNLGTLELTY